MILLAAAAAARAPQAKAGTADGKAAQAASSAAAAKPAGGDYHEGKKSKGKHGKHGHGHKGAHHGEDYYETEEPRYCAAHLGGLGLDARRGDVPLARVPGLKRTLCAMTEYCMATKPVQHQA